MSDHNYVIILVSAKDGVDEVKVYAGSDGAAWMAARIQQRKHKADDAWPERL